MNSNNKLILDNNNELILDNYWQEIVEDIHENANDLEVLQIIYWLVRDEMYRLSADLNNADIKKEYNTLSTMEMQLRKMVLTMCKGV